MLTRFATAALALALCLGPGVSNASVSHGNNAGLFTITDGIGVIETCRQLDNRELLGEAGLREFFGTTVPSNAELAAKLIRESPAERRQEIARGNTHEMCVAWTLLMNHNRFWADGQDAWLYAPDGPQGRPYLLPLLGYDEIVARATTATRAEVEAEYRRLLDHMGVASIDGGIATFDALVEDNEEANTIIDYLKGVLGVAQRDNLVEAAIKLFDEHLAFGTLLDDIQNALDVSDRDGILPAIEALKNSASGTLFKWLFALAALFAIIFLGLWLRSWRKEEEGTKNFAALKSDRDKLDRENGKLKAEVSDLRKQLARAEAVIASLWMRLGALSSALKSFGATPMPLPAGLYYERGIATVFVRKDGKVKLPGVDQPVSVSVAHETLRNSPEARDKAGVTLAAHREYRAAA